MRAGVERSRVCLALKCRFEAFSRKCLERTPCTRLYQAFTMEIQAQLNSDILEHMDSIEMDDWNRSGQVRDKWEKYLRFEGEKPAGKKKVPHKEEKPSPHKRTGLGAK